MPSSVRSGAEFAAGASTAMSNTDCIGDNREECIDGNHANHANHHGAGRGDTDIGRTPPGLEADAAADQPDEDGEDDGLDEAEYELAEGHCAQRLSHIARERHMQHGDRDDATADHADQTTIEIEKRHGD